MTLALAAPSVSARGEEPKKSSTAVDLKDVGRNIGQLGKEIKEAGQKVGQGVKEGSGAKSGGGQSEAASSKDKTARPKAEGRKATKATKKKTEPEPAPAPAPTFSR